MARRSHARDSFDYVEHKNDPDESARCLDVLAKGALAHLPGGSERVSTVPFSAEQVLPETLLDDRGIPERDDLFPLGERIASILRRRHPGDDPIIFVLSNLKTSTRLPKVGMPGFDNGPGPDPLVMEFSLRSSKK